MERDIALELPEEVSAGDLLNSIREQGGKYLRDVRVFDLYSGEGVDKEHKSLAYRLYFQSQERTLQDEEVDRQIQRIADTLMRRHQARWRQS